MCFSQQFDKSLGSSETEVQWAFPSDGVTSQEFVGISLRSRHRLTCSNLSGWTVGAMPPLVKRRYGI